MKYLRSFNESMLREDVIDMMLEISDMGYKCSVDTKWTGDGEATRYGQDQWLPNQNYIQISIEGKKLNSGDVNNKIVYDEILSDINRIAGFLKSQGYEMADTTIPKRNGTGWESITLKEFNELVEDGTLDIGWTTQRFRFDKV